MHVTKGQLMAQVFSGHQRECFTHSDEGTFDISAMRAALPAQLPHDSADVSLSQIIPFLAEHRVVEQARVQELSDWSWREDPGIFLVIPPKGGEGVTHLMVDGHHRAVRRHLEGMEDMRFYFVQLKDALRPAFGWVANPFVDWGDPIIDGRIVRRG